MAPIALPNEVALRDGVDIYAPERMDLFKARAGDYALNPQTNATLTQEQVFRAFQTNLTLKESLQILTYTLDAGVTCTQGNPISILSIGESSVNWASTVNGMENTIEFKFPFSILFSLVCGFEFSNAGASTNYIAIDSFNDTTGTYSNLFQRNFNTAGNLRDIGIINDVTTRRFRIRFRIDNTNQLAIFPLLTYINQ